MSPRPNYLSPTSTVPVPQEVDPVPRRPPTPSIIVPPSSTGVGTPTSSRPSSYSSSNGGPPSPVTARAPRHTRATGSSTIGGSSTTLEKFLSKTRPTHLPPKPRAEDLKHQRDWDEMMRRSRAADDARAERERARAREREMAAEEKMAIWEREIVPDWKRVLRPGADNERLRRLWWEGVPGNFRGRLWAAAIGNGLALSKETYKTCSTRAKRALAARTFPQDTLSEIENDVQNTLPNLHIFNAEYGPMHQDLKDLLCAWVVSRSDEGLGYVRGASNIAAMFILNMPLDEAFLSMRNLLERHCLRSFYGGEGSDDDVSRIFDTLLADGMPKVYFNFKQHQISPSLYLPDWVTPLFLNHLPFDMTVRIWDVIILEGDSFLFRVAIGVLGILESRLFFPDRKELLEVLRGENKAALDVARRTGISVDLSARYEQYGMSEKSLWERIHEQEEWWRESTWGRLITRELPDI
ncbi:RabGAP/TBC [Clavulina sp. PMI_390]|nr:RabGAP/TBC [Clavulina sp. PMI_390]